MNDPLDLLKDAWRDVDPPPISDDLADADATTRGTVDWMRAAWLRVPIPDVSPPPVRVPTPIHPLVSPLRAAAGFLFLSLAVGALQSAQSHRAADVTVAAALPTALDARLARERTSFVVPDEPLQASVLPAGALPADLAAQIASLAFGSGWIGDLFPSSDETDEHPAIMDEIGHALRAGLWSDAGAMARSLLDEPDLPAATRCEALLAVAYATRALGRTDDSAVYLNQLEQELAALPIDQREALRGAPLRDQMRRESYGPSRGDEWGLIDAGAAGMNRTVLDRHVKLAQESGADAILVATRGRIVSEWYAGDYNANEPFEFDAGAVLSLLCGALLADGAAIADVDQSLAADVRGLSGPNREITLRQLLNHTAGFAPGAASPLALMSPLAAAPGELFRYSGQTVPALGQALSELSGLPVAQLARHRLFEPLGLARTQLVEGESGWTVRSTPREMARIAQLVLNGGRIGDRQLVPTAWIERIGAPGHHRADFSHHWWLTEAPAGIAALGPLDNNLYVFSDDDFLVVRAQRAARPDAVRGYEPEAQSLFAQIR